MKIFLLSFIVRIFERISGQGIYIGLREIFFFILYFQSHTNSFSCFEVFDKKISTTEKILRKTK